MDLEIRWLKQLPLHDGTEIGLIYSFDWEKLPGTAGIYVFVRRWGRQFEALYVGKGSNLQGRARGQLNNLKLMNHVKNASNGKRFVLAGEFLAKPGQQQPVCLRHLERAFIRHYLSKGHDLVNIQGTRLRRHSVNSSGRYPRRWWPSVIYIEK